MHPNIIIGSIAISNWYTFLLIGIIIPVILAVYLRPSNFPLNRIEILSLALFLSIAELLGARILFILLHFDAAKCRLSDLVSFRGGFAYFGALIFSAIILGIYSVLRRVKFLSLLDYAMPFLMLSQVFVRIGCLLAGCCYGKPTSKLFGVIFKTVDKVIRHPTQGYEAVVLLFIYVISRFVYEKKRGEAGFTFFIALFLYGLGRFFIEYLRTDSPNVLFGLTLAQVSCLLIAVVALTGLTFVRNIKFDKKSN